MLVNGISDEIGFRLIVIVVLIVDFGDMCDLPVTIRKGVHVPCGKCGSCIQAKRLDWAVRLYYEALEAVQMAFITFTYEEKNLSYADCDQAVLNYADLRNFWKSARKAGFNFRYFGVGEYGEKGGRPHFHALVFTGVNDIDWNVFCNIWRFGFTHIGEVTNASIMYVTKDMLKEVDQYDYLEPEFRPQVRMSKGIGKAYIKKCRNWHKNDYLERDNIFFEGRLTRMPRYYRDKIFNRFQKDRLRLIRLSDLDRFITPTQRDFVIHYQRIIAKRKSVLRAKHFNKSL